MDRRVERSHIDRWIDLNGPDGVLELARKSKVSSSTIEKARLGRVPKKYSTRKKLFRTIGITEDELFPVLTDGTEKAS